METVKWKIEFSAQSKKDTKLLEKSVLYAKVHKLLVIIKQNPFQNPPPYEKLQPPRDNKYSRRINKQHRLVYEVLHDERLIRILSLWTHYE